MNLLALLFLIAASVWMIPLLKEGRLSRWITVLLLTGTIFGPPFFAIDGPIQISLDRILWAFLIAATAFQWRMGRLHLPVPDRIDLCLIALTLFLFWRSRGGDLLETRIDPTARWLFYIFMPMVTYGVARMARVSVRDLHWMLNGLIGLGIYLSFTAVCEVKGFSALVFPKFILDPDVWMFYGRGRGPLLNPAGNGFLIGTALAAVAACFVGAERRARFVYLVLGAILLIGCYATLTRSCWLGAVAAIGIVTMIHSPRWVRVLGLAATVLLAGAMTMGLKDQLLSLKRDKELSANESAKSVELRPLLAVVAWEMFKDKPIFGHGYGQYFQHHDSYHTIRAHDLPLERVRGYSQHNVFLALLVDSGLVGLTLFSASLALLASYGWRMARDVSLSLARRRVGLFCLAVIATYLPNAMFHDMTIIPMVQMCLWGTAGVIVTVYQNGFAHQESGDQDTAVRGTEWHAAPTTTPV